MGKMAGISQFQRKFLEKRGNYHFIRNMCDKFQRQLTSLYEHLLSDEHRMVKLDQLEAISAKFFSLKKELTLMDSGFETMSKFDYLIFRYSKDLIEMMKEVGATTCSDILELTLGDDYEEQINEYEMLNLYDKVFVPIRYKIKEPSRS